MTYGGIEYGIFGYTLEEYPGWKVKFLYNDPKRLALQFCDSAI